jgi:hypothetical protein
MEHMLVRIGDPYDGFVTDVDRTRMSKLSLLTMGPLLMLTRAMRAQPHNEDILDDFEKHIAKLLRDIVAHEGKFNYENSV